jgi:hypothetical protein
VFAVVCSVCGETDKPAILLLYDSCYNHALVQAGNVERPSDVLMP